MTIVFNAHKKQLAILVSTACLTMGSAFASNCGGATTNNVTVVSSDASTTCTLAEGESILIENHASLKQIHGGDSIGIYVAGGVHAGQIENRGNISKDVAGILVENSVANGILNTGTIDGTVVIKGAGIKEQLINNGQIIGKDDIAIFINGGDIAKGIVNDVNGRITSNDFGIALYSANVGGILNAGRIDTAANGWGIYVGFSSTVTGDIINSGTLNIGGAYGIVLNTATVEGSLINTGTIYAPGATAISIEDSELRGKIINSGTIIGDVALRIVYNPISITVENSGTLDGKVELSRDTLNINGNHARITGAVSDSMSGATININGKFTSENTFDVGTFNIAKGGTFNAGHHVTVANALNNNGTLAVRAGTPLIVTGNYTQAADAMFRTEVLSATDYGQMIVSGNAALAANTGIDVRVSSLAKLAPNITLAGIIQAGTLQASTFKVTDDSALFDFKGVVNGNNVDLMVSQASTVYGSTVENRNFVGAGAARELDKLIAGSTGDGDMGAVVTALGRLPSSKHVSDAVKQTLPLMTGATASAAAAAINQTGRIVQARQDANLGLSTGEDVISDKQIWAKPFGSWAKQGDRNGVSGFDASTGGIVVGADGVLTEHDRLGAAFAYAHTKVSGNDSVAAQSAKIDSYQAMLYGSHSIDERTELSWQGDLGLNRTDGERAINFGGLNRRAASNYNGWSAHVGTGVARVFSLNDVISVAPSLRLDYTSISNRGYTESGAGVLNLQVGSQRTEELIVAAESKLSYAVSTDATIVANLGVGYNLLAKSAQITSSFVGGGAAFTTEGLEPSPWTVRGGAGLILHRQGGTEVTARYDAEANRTGFNNQTVSLKVRQSF